MIRSSTATPIVAAKLVEHVPEVDCLVGTEEQDEVSRVGCRATPSVSVLVHQRPPRPNLHHRRTDQPRR